MHTSKNFIVVRELYAEKRGHWLFSRQGCQTVDFNAETVWSFDANNDSLSPLSAQGDCNLAIASGKRIFAISRARIIFDGKDVSSVCNENGYIWNYIVSGKIDIVDGAKFLRNGMLDNGSLGLNGLTSQQVISRVSKVFETSIREQIAMLQDVGQTVADIRSKDAIPPEAWNRILKQSSDLQKIGVEVTFSESEFVCPDLDLENARQAEEAARLAREVAEKREYEAACDKNAKQDELDRMAHERELAEKEYELKRAELEARINAIRIDQQIEEQRKIEEAKLAIEKARNDEEIRRQQALTEGDNLKAEAARAEAQAMSDTVAALEKRFTELSVKLEHLGVAADEAKNWQSTTKIDPVMNGGIGGLTDAMAKLLEKVQAQSASAVKMSWEISRSATEYRTRDLVCSRLSESQESYGDEDDVLHLNDRLLLRFRSERSGYLSLFNLGTSGGVTRMFPNKAFGTVDNKIEANKVYTLPGDLMSSESFPDGFWIEAGPVTSQYGFTERILAVVTDSPIELDDACFAERSSYITSVRGGFAAVEESVDSLFKLPEGSWSFGILEAKVER